MKLTSDFQTISVGRTAANPLKPLFQAMVEAGQSGAGNPSADGYTEVVFPKNQFFLDKSGWSLDDYAVNVQDEVRGTIGVDFFGETSLEDRGDSWVFSYQKAQDEDYDDEFDDE